jgi:hypothetical protein
MFDPPLDDGGVTNIAMEFVDGAKGSGAVSPLGTLREAIDKFAAAGAAVRGMIEAKIATIRARASLDAENLKLRMAQVPYSQLPSDNRRF